VDDERQAGLARGLDVDAQAVLLHLGAVGGVVVVEPAFADADELRVAARATSSSTVAMGSSAALIGWVPAAQKTGHGPRRWRAPAGACRSFVQIVTMRRDTGGHGARPRLGALAVEIGEIEVAMAVDDLEWWRLGMGFGLGRARGRSGGGDGQPLGGPVEIEEHIEDERGRVKVDRLAAPGPRGEVGGKLRPGAPGGGIGGEAVEQIASSPVTMGGGVWPVAPGRASRASRRSSSASVRSKRVSAPRAPAASDSFRADVRSMPGRPDIR
jgi:hypothetical protein